MADADGFLRIGRRSVPLRAPSVRVGDDRELLEAVPTPHAEEQAGRCMRCGVPFCHDRCPLHNLIPEWNALVAAGDWRRAYERLAATNSFPEFTARLCPAPCEPACVLEISDEAVTIKQIERSIIDVAFERRWVRPRAAATATGRRVAVVGSGPAGLAAAQQLRAVGHDVTVYERADRPGGLLRYGIPDFKMAKGVLDRRLSLLEREGVGFVTGCEVGVDVAAHELDVDAIVLAVGAERQRDLAIPGRQLDGVVDAMTYLTGQNRRVAGETGAPALSARGRDVVIIGAGDTAADCLGNAHRERAASVVELSLYPEPPGERPEHNRWPDPPLVLHVSSAHAEGGRREWDVVATRFLGDSSLEELEIVSVRVEGAGATRVVTPIAGTTRRIPCQLALLAIGFEGVRRQPLLEQLGLGAATTRLGIEPTGERPVVVAAGDAVTGAALVVTAIADGRRAAAACARRLQPEPVAR